MEEDPFFRHYFARVDRAVAASFSDAQRAAIKRMFGARGAGRHWVDLRLSVPFPGRRFYLVLLLGPERRAADRLRREGLVGGLLGVVALAAGLLTLAIPILIVAYLVKSALGIDLIPDGGLHDAIRQIGRPWQ